MSHEITPRPKSPTMSVEYSSKPYETPLESEAEKVHGSEATGVAVEHGGLSQYELANDPHRYVVL